MKSNRVVNFIGKIVNNIEPQYTIRLEDIVYSKPHGHEICILHLVGKNAFPKYTAEELVKNPSSMIGMSPQDAIMIERLNNSIKERRGKSKILELDKNGTILLRDCKGVERRYSEKFVSSQRDMIRDLSSEDAHDLGYRVGFKDGFDAKKFKNYLSKNLKAKLFELIKLPLK